MRHGYVCAIVAPTMQLVLLHLVLLVVTWLVGCDCGYDDAASGVALRCEIHVCARPIRYAFVYACASNASLCQLTGFIMPAFLQSMVARL